MTDPLTAEERVTLNRLMRKEVEHRNSIRLTYDSLIDLRFVALNNDRESIRDTLVDHADAFVAALKPFCKASQ